MQALSVLADSPALAAATALVLGLLVGSFLNVVIHRVPKMMEREWELQAAELDASKEQHDRSWAEREQSLAKREQEYAELKARAAAAPKDLEAAVAKAEAEGVGIAKRQAKISADLQQKTNEGKKRVYELRVAELDSTINKQNEQINELSKQLATALKQAQDLAIKAIDGASNSSSFAAVKEIALEQAKTSQKAK